MVVETVVKMEDQLTHLEDLLEYGLGDAVPLQGDSLAEVVAWQSGTKIAPQSGHRVTARLHVDRAEVILMNCFRRSVAVPMGTIPTMKVGLRNSFRSPGRCYFRRRQQDK